MAEVKTIFFLFSVMVGPKEVREGSNLVEMLKQVNITAPYCVMCI